MKKDNKTDIARLAKNIELSLLAKEQNSVAFTTDSKKYDITSLINRIARIYLEDNKKVLVMVYDDLYKVDSDIDSAYLSVSDNEYSIAEKIRGYDMAIVICPNISGDNSYMILSEVVKNLVIVSKKWQSKIPNIVKIKERATACGMDILGIVYQK